MVDMSSTLIVVDPNPDFRRSIRELLAAEAPEWSVAAECSTGREAVSATRRLKPDAVLLERSLPDENGLRVAEELHEAGGGAILMISIDWDAVTRREALAAGAADILYKQDAADGLVGALERVPGRGEGDPGSGGKSGPA